MREKFLVIGSNSFSGASFVAQALAAGAEVAGTSRSPEPAEVFLPYKWAAHDRFRFHQLDLNHDLEEIVAVADQFRPDYIVNYAAQSMVAQSWEHPDQWFQTNVVAMVRLHDRLRRRDFLKKFVQVSTPEIYGTTSGAIREDAAFNPSTPYAASKAACDLSLLTFLRAYGFPVAFTRAANICGPGQPLYRIIPRAILCILAGEKLRLQGGGVSVRSFLHARDAADATLLVARRAKPGDVYHLSTNQRVSIRTLVETICAEMDAAFEDCVEITEGRLKEDAEYCLDWTRARTELGWEPAHSLTAIIGETVNWMRGNWSEIRRQPREYEHKP